MINSPDWNQKISTMLSKIHFEEIGLGVYKASFPLLVTQAIKEIHKC